MMETYADRLKKLKESKETPDEFKKRLDSLIGSTITDPGKDKNVENVVNQLRDRAEKGLQKYGVTTERKDLSTVEWLQHLQEELMDACVYIQKIKTDIWK